MPAEHVSIGELYRQTAVHVETIRYYEKIATMPSPPRTSGGHRSYGQEHVRRLTFISRGRSLGFSLEENRLLLSLADGDNFTCADVRQMTLQHAQKARQKISDLRKLERKLRGMAAEL